MKRARLNLFRSLLLSEIRLHHEFDPHTTKKRFLFSVKSLLFNGEKNVGHSFYVGVWNYDSKQLLELNLSF